MKGLGHSIRCLFKKLNLVLASIKLKHYSSVLFPNKTVFTCRHWNCFLSSVAIDGKDVDGILKYSGSSPHGHSCKQTALLTAHFTKPCFSQLPFQLLYFYIPVSGQLQMWTHFFASLRCLLKRASTVVGPMFSSFNDLAAKITKKLLWQVLLVKMFLISTGAFTLWCKGKDAG